ncbi:hypothetical protein Pfo_018914 [Paulownia fortunei]|nr:hypothetical protein Pfo_018914 [Paulownia fortunei]
MVRRERRGATTGEGIDLIETSGEYWWLVSRLLMFETISIITNDGRNIVGILKGFDQATNIILDESHERVYSTKYLSLSFHCPCHLFYLSLLMYMHFTDAKIHKYTFFFLIIIFILLSVQQLVLGLYIIRGDNISIVGELDEELDASLDLSKLRAHPLKPVIH